MIQDNSKQIIKFIDNIEFSWEKKNWRMRILGAVFFFFFVFWRENSPRLTRCYLQIE